MPSTGSDPSRSPPLSSSGISTISRSSSDEVKKVPMSLSPPPRKELSMYRCIGTTYIDSEEFQKHGKPICYGIETKLKTSLEQQSHLRSMLISSEHQNKEWTFDSLNQYKQQRGQFLAKRINYPHDNENNNNNPSNQSQSSKLSQQQQQQQQHSRGSKKNNINDEFSYTCVGSTKYVLLENASDNLINDHNSNPSYDENINDFSIIQILAGPPKCTPGISIKTLGSEEDMKQYSLDLGVLRIEMLHDEMDADEEKDEEGMTEAKTKHSEKEHIKQHPALSSRHSPRHELHQHQQQQQEQPSPHPQQPKQQPPRKRQTETQLQREKQLDILNQKREKQRQEFLKQREKIYRDFEKERQRFFESHSAMKPPSHQAQQQQKQKQQQQHPEDIDKNNEQQSPYHDPHLSPSHPKRPPFMDSEAKKRERERLQRDREEALNEFWNQSKKEQERLMEFGNKTFGVMKKITSAVATELKDDFPTRVLNSSHRIVGQFGHTVQRCQKTAGMVYRFWTEDHDDDDDEDNDL